MDKNKIYFAKTREGAVIPRKRAEDGGYDIFACLINSWEAIKPHDTKLLPTGLYSAFSDDWVVILKERGSTGTKGIGQRCGVIDSGFRGEWLVPVTNHTDKLLLFIKPFVERCLGKERMPALLKTILVENGLPEDFEVTVYSLEKAICQALVVAVPKLEVEEITWDEIQLMESERGSDMLGSTNKEES